MSKDDTAAIVGSISNRIPSHIRLGSVTAEVPEIKIAITNSSKETIKAKRAAEIKPGLITGRVIRKNVFNGLAPRLRDARSNVSSNPFKVVLTITKT